MSPHTACRALTMDELETIYDARPDHSWPANTAPALYLETPDGWGAWVHWDHVREILEGRDPFRKPGVEARRITGRYGQAFRFWLFRPTEEESKGEKWEA